MNLPVGAEQQTLTDREGGTRIGTSTLGSLQCLKVCPPIPGDIYVPVTATRIHQSKRYSLADYSLKTTPRLDRQPTQYR